jgi:hypothetical protein
MLLMPPVSAACGATAACDAPAAPVIASINARSGLVLRGFFITVSVPFIAAVKRQ